MIKIYLNNLETYNICIISWYKKVIEISTKTSQYSTYHLLSRDVKGIKSFKSNVEKLEVTYRTKLRFGTLALYCVTTVLSADMYMYTYTYIDVATSRYFRKMNIGQSLTPVVTRSCC